MLWIVPTSAADLAATPGQSVEIAAGNKPSAVAPISSVSGRRGDASPQRDHRANVSDRNYFGSWCKKQFVLLLGIAY
jgi:hypothetical protein